MSARKGATYSAARIAGRVAEWGTKISRGYGDRRPDVLVTMDHGFIFAADLIRQISATTVCHFVRADVRDVDHNGHSQREVLFGLPTELKGRAVLVVVLDSGVTQEFLLRRLGESRSRSIRLAVFLGKQGRRRVALGPDYFGFQTASNQVWVGYGLAAPNGTGRNLQQLSSGTNQVSRKTGKGRKK